MKLLSGFLVIALCTLTACQSLPPRSRGGATDDNAAFTSEHILAAESQRHRYEITRPTGEIGTEEAREVRVRESQRIRIPATHIQHTRRPSPPRMVPHTVCVRVANQEPYPIRVVFSCTKDATQDQTFGWYRIGPGQLFDKTITLNLPEGVAPRFWFYGESCDTQVIRHVTGGNQDVVPFESGFMSGQNEGFLGVQQRNVKEVEFNHRSPSSCDDEPRSGLRLVRLIEMPISDGTAELTVCSKVFPWVSTASNNRESLRRARVLNEAITAQIQCILMREEIFEGDFPFFYGFKTCPEDDPYQPGVVVDEIMYSKTIFGDEVQLNVGDRILAVNGNDNPVFSELDLYTYLIQHATNWRRGGIRRPITFTVHPDGSDSREVVQIRDLYFYNPEWYGESTKEKLEAFVMGGVDAATVGLDSWIYGIWGDIAFDDDLDAHHRRWIWQEREARYMQMYGNQYFAGQWTGFVMPTVTSPLFRTVNARYRMLGAGRTASNLLTNASLELIETSVQNYMILSPLGDIDTFRDQMADDIKLGAPLVVIGTFIR